MCIRACVCVTVAPPAVSSQESCLLKRAVSQLLRVQEALMKPSIIYSATPVDKQSIISMGIIHKPLWMQNIWMYVCGSERKEIDLFQWNEGVLAETPSCTHKHTRCFSSFSNKQQHIEHMVMADMLRHGLRCFIIHILGRWIIRSDWWMAWINHEIVISWNGTGGGHSDGGHHGWQGSPVCHPGTPIHLRFLRIWECTVYACLFVWVCVTGARLKAFESAFIST